MEALKFFCVEVFDVFDSDKSVVVYSSKNRKFAQIVFELLDTLRIDVNWFEKTVVIDEETV